MNITTGTTTTSRAYWPSWQNKAIDSSRDTKTNRSDMPSPPPPTSRSAAVVTSLLQQGASAAPAAPLAVCTTAAAAAAAATAASATTTAKTTSNSNTNTGSAENSSLFCVYLWVGCGSWDSECRESQVELGLFKSRAFREREREREGDVEDRTRRDLSQRRLPILVAGAQQSVLVLPALHAPN